MSVTMPNQCLDNIPIASYDSFPGIPLLLFHRSDTTTVEIYNLHLVFQYPLVKNKVLYVQRKEEKWKIQKKKNKYGKVRGFPLGSFLSGVATRRVNHFVKNLAQVTVFREIRLSKLTG